MFQISNEEILGNYIRNNDARYKKNEEMELKLKVDESQK